MKPSSFLSSNVATVVILVIGFVLTLGSVFAYLFIGYVREEVNKPSLYEGQSFCTLNNGSDKFFIAKQVRGSWLLAETNPNCDDSGLKYWFNLNSMEGYAVDCTCRVSLKERNRF